MSFRLAQYNVDLKLPEFDGMVELLLVLDLLVPMESRNPSLHRQHMWEMVDQLLRNLVPVRME